MAIKTYGIDGHVAARWPLQNPTGDVTFVAVFRNGCVDEGHKRPATCLVMNPVDQLIVENHRLFKAGVIRLISVSGTAETVRTKEVTERVEQSRGRKGKSSTRTVVNSGVKDDASGMTAYPEAKTIGDVTNILLSLGVSMELLRDEQAILEKAGEMKLYFPNYEG